MWVTKILDKGGSCKIVFLDLSAAFDLVPHQIIIKRLLELGVNPKLVKFIEIYLKNRKRRVMVNSEKTRWVNLEKGVPQDSALGPILFKIFIAELPLLLNSRVLTYADDIKLLSTNDITLQKDLDVVSKWAAENGMVINNKKTTVLSFGQSNGKEDLFYNGERLEYAECTKDLGVYVDTDMKYHSQVNEAVKKANNLYYLFKQKLVYWNMYTTKIVIKSYIRPVLEYSSSVWNTGYEEDKRKLENVQRRVTKLCPEIRNLSYTERLSKLELPDLTSRRERGEMINLFKILNGHKTIFNEYFTLSEGRTRGHNKKIWQNRVNTEIGKRSFPYRTVQGWNRLSQETVDSGSVNEFKRRYDNL